MSDFTTDGPSHAALKAAFLAARAAPATDTRESIDAELRGASDRSLASMVEHDCPDVSVPWARLSGDEKLGRRARNETFRREHAAERQAASDATSASATAQHTAASDAARAALRRSLATPGLQGTALENAIDAVLTSRAVANMDALLEAKRKAYGSF